ncbi:MAG: ferrous iron transport protein A [Gammaproteobacteria bacterium]|nr:ferrous iron transport protein A [Gammaproteobacteria bacterium]
MLKQQKAYLDQLAPGARAIVSELQGGRGFASRLAGMGISVGCEIEMLQNPARGPLLMRVRDTRIALGRGEASKIVVRESEQGQPDAAE